MNRSLACIVRSALVAMASASSVTLAASASVDEFVAAQPAELQPLFATLFAEGERNAVLNFNRLGLAAMQRGQLRIAEHAFDESLLRIEAIYANDPQAQKAKSVWSEEKIKDFKGEPYERAMAYYYRGILYLTQGDYENARAAFVAGEYQDTMSEKEEFAGDFSVLSYLAGWASQCAGDGDRAGSFYEAARNAGADLTVPSVEHNALLLIDAGSGPRKTASGKHSELLEFVPGETGTPAVPIVAAISGTSSTPGLAADVNWQAATRGGRPIQAILEGKAQWKSATAGAADLALTASTVASTASILSTDVNQSMDFANAGLLAAGIGLFANMAASAMKPAADTRYWETLPGAVFVVTSAGIDIPEWQVQLQEHGPVVAPSFAVRAGNCSMTWVSANVNAPIAATAPNSALTDSARRRHERSKTVRAKNDALQASVLSW